jgi:hypothetical protein
MIMPTTPPNMTLSDTFLMACSARMTEMAIKNPKNSPINAMGNP